LIVQCRLFSRPVVTGDVIVEEEDAHAAEDAGIDTIETEPADDHADFHPFEIADILSGEVLQEESTEANAQSATTDGANAAAADNLEMDESSDNNEDDETEEEETVVYNLPPHRKCACHSLNLVATTDVEKLSGPVGNLKKISVQTFAKLSAIWNKQNRSSTAADAILKSLGTLFITPGETRWNSYYDSVSRVNDVLVSSDLSTKFDVVCDELGIKRLIPTQKRFISEYVQVFKPVCCGLDILQGDRQVSLGYLLPALHVMISDLDKLLKTGDADEIQLTMCEPLVHALKKGLQTRFGDVLGDTDAQLAAVVHPKFKLDWVDENDHVERRRLVDLLKNRVISVANSADVSRGDGDGVDHNVASVTAAESECERNFFSQLAARRRQLYVLTDSSLSTSQEVEAYLSDLGTAVDKLSAYPNIRKLYIQLNTGLPASAAVERLFSLGGRIFTPLRSRMSGAHFEMLMFMRMSKNF